MGKLIGCFIVIFFSVSLYAKTNSQDFPLFEKIFSDWTEAFNHKNLAQSCQLFSKDVIATYQDYPTKNYDNICNGFKKIFSNSHLIYQYHFKLHNVYQSENLAAVRITWYLKLFENGKLKSETQDEGLDIFQKNSTGKWEIVNYLGYQKKGAKS